jgi:glycosyltransferase involved in cell wall biosynthesis
MIFFKHIYRIAKFISKYFYSRLLLVVNNKSKVEDFLSKNRNKTLIITHNLGGGTDRYINNILRDNSNVVILSNYSYLGRDFLYKLFDFDKKACVYIQDFNSSLTYLNPSKIIINSLVSFYSYNKIINVILSYKHKNDIDITYMVHDYHCVCPNYNLVADDKYCELQCSKYNCFSNEIEEIYNYYHIKNIDNWRRIWEVLFENASEIRCFSNSSREIIRSVYKNVNGKIISVIPHDMSYFKTSTVDVSLFPFKVGVFGNCMDSVAKGRFIVKKFLKYSVKNNISVVLVGNVKIRDKIWSKKIKYIGRYTVDNLRSIVINNKISVVLFPSICPETFSYLVSELMMLGVPVLCFNYGAQAEKIKQYEKGKISLNENNMEILYHDLLSLYNEHSKNKNNDIL